MEVVVTDLNLSWILSLVTTLSIQRESDCEGRAEQSRYLFPVVLHHNIPWPVLRPRYSTTKYLGVAGLELSNCCCWWCDFQFHNPHHQNHPSYRFPIIGDNKVDVIDYTTQIYCLEHTSATSTFNKSHSNMDIKSVPTYHLLSDYLDI